MSAFAGHTNSVSIGYKESCPRGDTRSFLSRHLWHALDGLPRNTISQGWLLAADMVTGLLVHENNGSSPAASGVLLSDGQKRRGGEVHTSGSN